MYTEEYEHKGFPLGSFLLKLIIILVFVFLLIWLVPKFLKPSTIVKDNNKSTKEETKEVLAAKSQIFQDNLNKMKDAAISYFTDERLPANVGESKTLTLRQMIGEKLITPLIDKNNKAVDVEKSYVKITKQDDEYILKVNLKDSEGEDYILVHLGCYTYCKNSICEKKNTTVAIKSATTNTQKSNNSNNSNSNSNSNNSKYNSTSVSSSKQSQSSKSSSNSSSNSSSSSSSSNNSSSNNNNNNNNQTNYLYEYQIASNAKFSAWTSWSNWETTSCQTQEVNCKDNDITCLKKVQLYSQKEKIGTYQNKYTQQRQVLKQTGQYYVRACSNYEYVIIDNTTIATTTTTTYTTINNVTYQTQSNVCGSTCSWTYAGRASYTNPPRDTATVHYVFAGADYSYCEETCTTLPKYFYDKYIFNGSTGGSTTVKVVTPGETTSDSTTKVTQDSTITVTANCGQYATKTIPIYSSITVTDIATREEPLYGTVCYKSTKTRELLSTGKITTKWSTYNDRSLLDSGWSYTGKKKAA